MVLLLSCTTTPAVLPLCSRRGTAGKQRSLGHAERAPSGQQPPRTAPQMSARPRDALSARPRHRTRSCSSCGAQSTDLGARGRNEGSGYAHSATARLPVNSNTCVLWQKETGREKTTEKPTPWCNISHRGRVLSSRLCQSFFGSLNPVGEVPGADRARTDTQHRWETERGGGGGTRRLLSAGARGRGSSSAPGEGLGAWARWRLHKEEATGKQKKEKNRKETEVQN